MASESSSLWAELLCLKYYCNSNFGGQDYLQLHLQSLKQSGL
ncbi:hypothetical protein PanWU01x14_220440 [Parasponia andersonii]|uniref:Uncharacterized protein n=1 Tax=Parasponia andersonii TaxID=3476 RepID=A0A2P5BQ39_PARAD|nr:hypothetical protein PanWU01x14_220440 [Parasponia andersonii]